MRPMFRKLLLTVFIAAAAFIANAQTAKTPLEFNDELVKITNSLFSNGQEWGKAFNEAYKAGNYTTMKPARERLQVFVDAQLKYVTALKDVNNSKPLRQAFIDFLNFEKKMITEAFLPFESLPADVSREEIQKWAAKLKEYSAKESGVMSMVYEAQKRYAEENGFTIQ